MRAPQDCVRARPGLHRFVALARREQQLPEGRGWSCWAEKISLHFGAAEGAEQIPLLFCFHAFRRRHDVARRGNVYDRLHDAG